MIDDDLLFTGSDHTANEFALASTMHWRSQLWTGNSDLHNKTT